MLASVQRARDRQVKALPNPAQPGPIGESLSGLKSNQQVSNKKRLLLRQMANVIHRSPNSTLSVCFVEMQSTGLGLGRVKTWFFSKRNAL